MASRVKVFVRLRPLLKKEAEGEMPDCCARKVSNKNLQLWNHRNPNNDAIEYEFDNVFDNDTAQMKVYESVKCIIPNVLSGQNATIFGYGPTGAGKTHTIVGTKEQPGLIPRCINYIFKLVKSKEAKEHCKETFSVHFSMLEIYQEKVYDLIEPKSKDLPIRQDCNGNIIIPELAEVKVDSFKEFVTKYQSASNNRTIGATNLNKHSSRSHTILLVKVVKEHTENPSKKYIGKLYLIDLAGSEDNRKTGNTGVRLKESGAINSSLFSLSMVVDALNKGLQRIPYRDSKLTRLLQDSIGGTAHSVMIACIAPEPSFYWDTLNTLKFASKSRQVVNKPFTKVVHERPLKRPNPSSTQASEPKRPALDKTKKIEESSKENQETIVNDVKKILGPIGKRQDELESKFESRFKMLENLLVKNQENSKEKRLPLSESTNKMIPIGKVKPLMKKTQPVLCQTPPAKEEVILINSPSPENNLCRVVVPTKMREECEVRVLDILNNGTIKDIMALPTIGKKRAEQLMAYREQNNKFSSLSDLLKAGYSKSMLENFKKKHILQRLVIS